MGARDRYHAVSKLKKVIMRPKPLIVLILLLGWQALDIAVHVATGQVELQRIAGSLVISAGALIFYLSNRDLLVLSGAVYLALNVAFLAQHGLVNPASGALRVPLFVFVLVSLGLLLWLRRRRKATER